MKLLVATTSVGKLEEIKAVLGNLPLIIISASDVDLPPNFRVKEVGKTFRENAALKAKTYAKATGMLTMADDSGLCVDALNGRPGVKTARYASGTDKQRWQKLLKALSKVPSTKRTAKFVCALAVYQPQTKRLVVQQAQCLGKIASTAKGKFGFGYDPIFVVDKLGKHFAELSLQEKNQVSHRALAVKKIKPYLVKLIENEI